MTSPSPETGGAPSKRPDPTGIDAFRADEIARRVEEAGVAKTRLQPIQLMALAVLAGAFIAFGAALYTAVLTGVGAPASGPVRLLGGIGFSLGLILVVVGGAELFTGNALLVMAWVDRRITGEDVLRNWGLVFFGNLVGAVGLAVAMAATGLLETSLGRTTAEIAGAKAELSFTEAFARGVLCNALVCLAVWLSFAARSATDKIIAVILPISAFVTLGFEHSIANLYLFPAGIFAGADLAAGGVLSNLVAVTLGNIVGGAGGVALSYWAAYRPRARVGAAPSRETAIVATDEAEGQ